MALGPAIVTEAFPSSERGKALGINSMMVSIGSISGPTIGGVILSSLSWNWIFFVNLPVGIVGVLLALKFIPETAPRGEQKFDFIGAGMLFGGLLCFLLALTFGQNIGFLTMPVPVLFAAAVILIAIFIRVETRVSQPIIELSLFRNTLLTINILTGLCVFISASANVLLMPFFLQNVLHFPPNQAGLLLATVPVAMIVTAPIMGSLSDKIGSRPLAMVGLLILVLSFLGVSTLDQSTTALKYFLYLLPVGIGMGTFNSPNSSAIMGSAPRERMGVVSSMLALTRTLGQTTGHAINGAIWASLVRFYAGNAVIDDVTVAPDSAQVAGLNGTLQVMVGLLTIALGLGIWAFLKDRQERRLGVATSRQV
jgi:EmrB/QacA subfamily drug resistance transporter